MRKLIEATFNIGVFEIVVFKDYFEVYKSEMGHRKIITRLIFSSKNFDK